MMAIEAVERTCTKCEAVKPGSAFYVKDGGRFSSWCKDCDKAAVKASQARRRELMGDEAYREMRRKIAARSRRYPEVAERGRTETRARGAALQRLSQMYPDAFAALLRQERSARGLDPEAIRGPRT